MWRVVIAYLGSLWHWLSTHVVLLDGIELGLLVETTSVFESGVWHLLLLATHLLVKGSVLASISSSFADRVNLSHLDHRLLYLHRSCWLSCLTISSLTLGMLLFLLIHINPVLALLLSIIDIFIHLILLEVNH